MASDAVIRVLAVMRAKTELLARQLLEKGLLAEEPPPCTEFVIVKLPDREPVVGKDCRVDYRNGTRDKRCCGQKPRYKRRRKKYVALGRVGAWQ